MEILLQKISIYNLMLETCITDSARIKTMNKIEELEKQLQSATK